MQMQDAGGKLAAFDVHHTKAGWAWEGFEGLRDLGDLETGRRRGQHSQAVPLDFLIQMHMAADHPAHVGVLPKHINELCTIGQVHRIHPGQAQGPGMMMQKHQGGVTTVYVQIDLQPRELGYVKIPPSLVWLMCVQCDKVIALVIEAVMVGRVRG